MTIGEFQPGERFRLAESPARTGTVVRIGVSSAAVRYDGQRHRHVRVRRGTEVIREAEFDIPNKVVTISLGTAVERV